jgi:hypothetical protein
MWVLLSAAISFVCLDWVAIHATGLGRGTWLVFTLLDAKGSIAKAIAIVDRRTSKPANAQPPATA